MPLARAVRSGKLTRGDSEDVNQLLNEYASADTKEITFEQYKRGVRKAIKRHKKDDIMGSQGVGASHLGR
eukprot:COSAG02_NODE_19984_length_854_cov_0.888742_1_plen_70_part_00